MQPRWTEAKRKAYQFLIDNNIYEFPVDLKKIIHRNKWKLSELEEAAKYSNIPSDEFQQVAMQAGDGVVFYFKDCEVYHIVYKKSKPHRERFTLAHEIGHIQLDHLNDYNVLNCHSKQICIPLKKLEIEANAFAARLIAPFTVIMQHELYSPAKIVQEFGISLHAADVKLQEMKRLKKIMDRGEDIYFPEARLYEELYKEYWSGGRERINSPKTQQVVCGGFAWQN